MYRLNGGGGEMAMVRRDGEIIFGSTGLMAMYIDPANPVWPWVWEASMYGA